MQFSKQAGIDCKTADILTLFTKTEKLVHLILKYIVIEFKISLDTRFFFFFFSSVNVVMWEDNPISSINIILGRLFASPWVTHMPIIQRNSALSQLLQSLIYGLHYPFLRYGAMSIYVYKCHFSFYETILINTVPDESGIVQT